jgi:hypothetical protein
MIRSKDLEGGIVIYLKMLSKNFPENREIIIIISLKNSGCHDQDWNPVPPEQFWYCKRMRQGCNDVFHF